MAALLGTRDLSRLVSDGGGGGTTPRTTPRLLIPGEVPTSLTDFEGMTDQQLLITLKKEVVHLREENKRLKEVIESDERNLGSEYQIELLEAEIFNLNEHLRFLNQENANLSQKTCCHCALL